MTASLSLVALVCLALVSLAALPRQCSALVTRLPILRSRRLGLQQRKAAASDDEFDVEQVLKDIAAEKDSRKAAEAREKLEQRRAVLQKRSDKNYEEYWREREGKELKSAIKDQATLRSYYGAGVSTSSNGNSSSIGTGNSSVVISERVWDYQAVPVNPARGDGLGTAAVGVALLATLLVGRKLIVGEEGSAKRRNKDKPIRQAIVFPGVGPVYVD